MSGAKPRPAAARRDAAEVGGKAAAGPGAAATPAERPESGFERFVSEFIAARGGSCQKLPDGHWQASFDPALARRLRRQSARLVFDPGCAILPRGGIFMAPASRAGLILLETARGPGHVAREWREAAPGVDAGALARGGFVVHDARLRSWELGEPRYAVQILFHVTMTLKGGGAEQDLRMVLADPRGPAFEFVEPEERRGWRLRDGFPAGPVWWGDREVSRIDPAREVIHVWSSLIGWLSRVQEPRLERWRRRCEETRERDLARINGYFETRLQEEQDRRRRRSEMHEEEDHATEAELKLEWERRVRSVRARWDPRAELRLWGVEEIARPRVPVTWRYDTPAGPQMLSGEVDLADGAVARLPCPVCGRPVGEYWWEKGFVCRRCRGRGSRASEAAVAAGGAGTVGEATARPVPPARPAPGAKATPTAPPGKTARATKVGRTATAARTPKAAPGKRLGKAEKTSKSGKAGKAARPAKSAAAPPKPGRAAGKAPGRRGRA